jgi:hypothetical protein
MTRNAAKPTARALGQRIAILLAAILQVVATTLPALGIGEPIGSQSDEVRTLITPAGWAFSIWGPLFAGSLAYSIYQLLPAQQDSLLLARIGWASGGAFLGNAMWALYAQLFGLAFPSAMIIAFTLLCLLFIYRIIVRSPAAFTRGEHLFVVLPFSALAAWLTAATIVNIAAVLVYHGLNVGDAAPLVAASIVIVGGSMASAAVWGGRGNPWYSLVFLWALAGIHGGNAGEHDGLVAATVLAGILVAGAALARLAHAEDRARWFRAGRRDAYAWPS